MAVRVFNDKIFQGFLEAQHKEGIALAHESDLLDLSAQGHPPYQCWIAEFHCKGFIRNKDGEVSETNDFRVRIYFPDDYLRRCNPMETLTWLKPKSIWHPNISSKVPLICIGRMTPGTTLVDILYQVFEVITYNKVTMVESDALNTEACRWARLNTHRFPIDNRPLKRRRLNLLVKTTKDGVESI
jgi:hypothetical protein